MKLHHSAASHQHGFISGKFAFLCAAVAVWFMFNNASTTPKVMGKSQTALQTELGQPVHKEKIPRPR